MAIVLPLRKSSLRKMIQERHNNQRDINLTVLEKLKPIVCDIDYQHGDLKVNLKINNIRLNSISLRTFWSTTKSTATM